MLILIEIADNTKENIKSFYSVLIQQTSEEKHFIVLKNVVFNVLVTLRDSKKPVFVSVET